ncbi:helix-turn-helix domain-containing protein [Labilibaculum antarcticum]|nr:helix-turn-helix transcriptional regulator [Labilibaculum antarcticum]
MIKNEANSKYSTKKRIDHFNRGVRDYSCIRVEEFLPNLKIPVPPIKENSVSLIYITEGVLNIKVGYSDYTICQSELLIIQPFKPYSIEKESSNAKGIILQITADGMIGTMGSHSLIFNLDILETWSRSKYSIDKKLSHFIENIFERIYLEYCGGINNLMLVNAYAITLILELNGISKNLSKFNSAAIDLTHRFKKEVYNRLEINLPISEYAKHLSVTPNHLNKSIKLVTGESTSSLLSKIKLTEAKYLLFMAELTIADIADKLGFDDSSYFSRFFKKHEGISPVEYRSKSRFIANE